MRANAAIFLVLLVPPGAAMAGGTVTACASDVQQNVGLNLKDAVAGGGTVYFDCAESAVIRITQTHHLTRSVEIDGGGRITLAADPAVAMFTAAVSAESVVLRNLVLRGARSVTFGGVFSGQASDLKLFNVTAESVGQSPGPVFGFAGGSIIRANRINAENCRFRDNAGAVLLAPTLVVRRSEFLGNAGQPFMPDFVDDGGEAIIEDSTFSSNGVSVWRGSIQIRNSGFFSNGRGSPAFGGALILRGTATIEKTQFLNNRAPNGAAVWFSSGELTLRRATFEANIATGVGGALGVSSAEAPAKVSIRHSHFRRNQAVSGGAIAFQRAPASERTLRGFAVNFANNIASQNGGAIDAPSGVIDLTRVQMVENQAAGIGGAVNGGGDFNLTRLANTLAVRNAAATGGVYSGLKLELINATVADNEGGPAIALLPDVQATAKFTNTIFSRNAGGSCVSLPGGEVGTFTNGGHNVQFPTTDCGATLPVVDPGLDSMYVPIPSSPVRFAGDTPVCLATPISGRDMFNDPRPQARGQCTIGAIESTIEPHALRALCRTDAPGKLADLLELVCSVGRPKQRPDDKKGQ